MSTISYTFPANCKKAELRGVTAEGGKPSTIVINRQKIKGVMFETEVGGQKIFATLADKPDLQAAVENYEAGLRNQVAARQAALEANVPGVTEVLAAASAAYNEEARYSNAFEEMMGDESNDGARPPRAFDESLGRRLAELTTTYPRAALYLRAKEQAESAHWADNTGAGSAGKRAMEILASGGDMAAAESALTHRREFVD